LTLVLVLEGRWHEARARAFAPSNNNSHANALGSGRHLGRPRTDGLDTTDRPPLCSRKRQQILQASLTKELSSLTVVELKGLLKAQGCTVSGRKAELIQRLESAFAVDDVIAEGISNSSSSTPILVKKRPAVRQRKEKQQQLPPKKKAVSIVDANLDEEFDSIFGQTPSPGQSSAHSDASSLVAAPDDVHPLTPKTVLEKNNGFSNMCLPRPVLRQLSKMNIEEPTPIQRDSIPVALDGIDVMGLAQTGTGKTLAFGIPLVSKLLDGSDNDARSKRNVLSPGGVSALVLAPTRELANQIAEQLQSLTAGTPISTMAVYGGGPRVQTQANKLKKGTHILVATPGRLIDLLDRGAISLRDCRFLTLDEADHMLDMGFAPSLKRIVRDLPPNRQTMLFSATMNKSMAEVAKVYLKNPVRVEVARVGMTADKITQEVHFVAKMDKMTKLLSLMKKHVGERTLIFGRTKHGMEKLCKRLNHAGVGATSIHGNKSQPQRDRAVRDFKMGKMKVLVATDVAARGLDIPEVKHVYNYELPDQAEMYVHRIGRTARAGKEGNAVAFCSEEEMNDLAAIEKVTGIQIPVASGHRWRSKDRRPAAGSSAKWRKKRNQNQTQKSERTARRVYR